MLMRIMTNFVERLHKEANEQRLHQAKRTDAAKGHWNHGYGTNSESSLHFNVKQMDKEDRRKVSSSLKIVLRKEGPGSTVKI